MKREQLVPSVDTCTKMKELGYPQNNTIFAWGRVWIGYEWSDWAITMFPSDVHDRRQCERIAAPTAQEIDIDWDRFFVHDTDGTLTSLSSAENQIRFGPVHYAEARAQAWLWQVNSWGIHKCSDCGGTDHVQGECLL